MKYMSEIWCEHDYQENITDNVSNMHIISDRNIDYCF